ncbi:MAG TPA: lantibiotic dehydratase [Chitinophagaceae bacterium]|jgi:thiopeptide-type bacteriocin biosynthesis protein|nr:lantibiotic dehydratase [Chitinophagaceae bacterium]
MSQSTAGSSFQFLDQLVLRTPAIPFVPLLDEEKVNGLLLNTDFLEAIYLASPVLYNECIRLRDGQIQDEKEAQKIRTSLIKYFQRMYSRSTPFGLFSGCSLINWGESDTNIILPSDSFLRSTRLDMHYLCALGQHLSSVPAIKERLLYFPNNSAYKMGNEVRYVEYKYMEGKRVHQISSVLHSDYVDAVLKKATAGATTGEIANLLVEQEAVSETEALEFVDELIASQLLVSELDPAITGDEFIYQLLASLRRINSPASAIITDIIHTLEEMVGLLGEIDANRHNGAEIYRSVIDRIKLSGVPFEEGKLFQVDMYNAPGEKVVSNTIQADLLKSINVLAKLFSNSENKNLSSFAERFRKRYEDQQVPLLHVLDAETGIGYTEQSGANLSPLLDNLVLPAGEKRDEYEIKWNKTEQWLFDHLLKKENVKELIIEEKELADFTTDLSRFPPSLSVLFSVVEGDKIVFKGSSGSSAANLLGRFAHADEKINELVLAITKQEQLINDEVVFAEIVHLPEDRVGNILLHPAFRDHEIPYLASSSLPSEKQVLLQDIMVSVAQDKQVRLFSRKLNKEIIPRLSSAHNFGFRSLPVYHFLADMQTQGLVNGLLFNWGAMARHFNYLPRVSYGNIILFEAIWQLRKADIEKLITAKQPVQEAIAGFQAQWQLPGLFVLADGDNELLVDVESKESAGTFIKTIKGRNFITLKEFLPPAGAVKDENGMSYNNQFVAVLMNKEKVYRSVNPTGVYEDTGENTTRNFLPGSEWLYYKIYCGSKTADEILTDCLRPLTTELLGRGLVDKWFFIRYYDTEFHLRVRFHIPDTANLGKTMELFLNYLENVEQAGLAWKIQTDTYQREVERYGNGLIELAEQLFFADSEMKLEFLLLTGGDERERYRWLWGLRGVDELLNVFDYSLDKKYELLQGIQGMFAKEFNADKGFYRQINQRFSDNRSLIQMAMEDPVSPGNEMKPLIGIFDAHRTEMQKIATAIAGKTGPDLTALMGSYIHMNLNRLFLSEPRLHEMVIYDLLCSYYRSAVKRKKG